MSDVMLEIENLSKSFGGVQAVRDCTFSIRAGHVTGLIGPNGAGKSTVVDLVSGFGIPDSGTVKLAGEQIIGLRPHVLSRLALTRPARTRVTARTTMTKMGGKSPHAISRLGLIRTFQTPREWRSLTVMDNVLLAKRQFARESLWRSIVLARALKRAEEPDRVQVREILDRFQLTALKNDRAGSLSGGQKRLLEFARIAAADPRVIILDEPMGGVNPVLGVQIGDAVRHFAQAGHAVMVVEHNLPFIERTCDEVVVMDLGEVIAQGTFASLRDNPRVVDAYLGMDLSHE